MKHEIGTLFDVLRASDNVETRRLLLGSETIRSIAAKIGCTAKSLRQSVCRTEVDTGRRDGITSDERARIKDLEREVRELRRTNEILRKASGFSHRRSSTADRSDASFVEEQRSSVS